jgi:hypothetical protein
MQVKVTKVLAKELNKRFKKVEGFTDYIAVVEWAWDYWEGSKKVITIYYPPKYYAYPRNINDNDLLRVYKDSDKTFDGFFESLLDFVEI